MPEPTTLALDYSLIQQELSSEIIPFVAKNYRTIESRESRGIAGLSAGGGIVMNVGLKSLDSFAWLGEFSAGVFGGSRSDSHFEVEKVAPDFYKDPEATNRLKLLYMSCGDHDPRMPFQKKAFADFQTHRIKVIFASFPGEHEWKVWRHSLADFAPRLFR